MTSYDNLDIGTLGERKRAIFCVIPDNDNSFNYLVGMLYTQAFQALYFNADNNHGGELPIPVHIVMDEFANVALPDNFERYTCDNAFTAYFSINYYSEYGTVKSTF